MMQPSVVAKSALSPFLNYVLYVIALYICSLSFPALAKSLD